MRKTTVFVAALVAAMALVSCQKESSLKISDKTIKARITSSGLDTKALASSEELEYSETYRVGQNQLMTVDMFSSDRTLGYPQTKGYVVTTENFQKASVDAFLDIPDGGITNGQGVTLLPHYIDKGFLLPDGSVTDKNGQDCYWVNAVKMDMWCYSGIDNLIYNGSKASFQYTTPADLAQQKDIIVSHNEATYRDGNSDLVDVRLYHALAAVKFDVRLLSTDIRISDLKLTNVRTSGTCEITPDGQSVNYSWTPSAAKADFSQDYSSGKASYQDSFLPRKSQEGDENLYFFIPQVIDPASSISMTLENSHRAPKLSTVPANGKVSGASWNEGKTYRYRIAVTEVKREEQISDGGEISFQGKGGDWAMYQSLSLNEGTQLKLAWDFEAGNSRGITQVRICPAGGYDKDGNYIYNANNGVIIYSRIGSYIFQPRTDSDGNVIEKNDYFEQRVDIDAGNEHNGFIALYFTIKDLGFSGPYDIVFDYNGGNNGAAAWKVKNLSVSIID